MRSCGSVFSVRFRGFVLTFGSIGYRGGLELLFGSQKKHEVDVVPPNGMKEVLDRVVSTSFEEDITHKNQPLQ